MKLLIVSCIVDYKEQASQILERAKISSISSLDTTEFESGQTPNLIDGWFAIDKEYSNSTILFSVATKEQAQQVLTLAKEFNDANDDKAFPIKIYVVPVEAALLS